MNTERLKQLRHKAQHEELTAAEKQEIINYANEFTASMKPVFQSMVDLHGEVAEDLTGALEPLVECVDALDEGENP